MTSLVLMTLIWADEADVEPYVSIPSTISEQAKAFLRVMPDPALQPALPGPNEFAQWSVLQEIQQARNTERAKPLIERIDPVVTQAEMGSVPVLDVRPKDWRDNGKVLVYTHGGAFTFNDAESTLGSAALMADATGMRVVSVDYTLAPHAKWQQVLDETVAVFSDLLASGYDMDDIAIYGDSAGGAKAASVVLKMRNEGMGMPAAVVLLSPWSDITETGDTYETLKLAEPFYLYETALGPSANAYADPEDQKHPYVSPVYGDYSKGFPPTLIQCGTKEIFVSNCVRHYQAIDTAGQTVKLDLYEGMPHVFQMMIAGSPESDLALTKIDAFLEKHLVD